MNLAEAGAAFLNAAMKEAVGVTICYQPIGGLGISYTTGDERFTAWTGTPGQDEALTARVPGTARLVVRERDYLIEFADLTKLTDGKAPREGDRITERIGEKDVTFEVCKRGTEPCWRWSDRERTRVRVHTKPITRPEDL